MDRQKNLACSYNNGDSTDSQYITPIAIVRECAKFAVHIERSGCPNTCLFLPSYLHQHLYTVEFDVGPVH